MLKKVGGLSRRELMIGAGCGALVVTLLPATASATPDAVQAEIAKLYPGKTPKEGKINLDLPSIAENGLVIPMNFEVESPMTEKDYVKKVHFWADGNPSPGIASFTFTPMAPKAAAQIRIRLAKTQNVVAVAEMSNGELYIAKKEVKVTIGGCGG
jgi:sulfur-oxidizing protein SoxY